MKSLITVLLPVYNAELYIKKTIESLLVQTFDKFELLIINDGSTDDSESLINSFADARIRFINHKKNKGIAARLNEGLKLAKGKYIARADADDLHYPQRLEKQLYFLKKNCLGVVGAWAKLINSSDKAFGFDHRPNDHWLIKWSLLLGSNPLIHPSVMFVKNIVLKAGGYSPSWQDVEDYELWSRLIDKTRFGILEENLISLRVHKNSVSHTHSVKQIAKTIKLCQQNVEQLLEQKLDRKQSQLLSLFCQRKKCPQSKDVPAAFSLLQKIYQHFLTANFLEPSNIHLINFDYSQKTINLLNINQAFDRKLLFQRFENPYYGNILFEAYKKNVKLLLRPILNLFLVRYFVYNIYKKLLDAIKYVNRI